MELPVAPLMPCQEPDVIWLDERLQRQMVIYQVNQRSEEVDVRQIGHCHLIAWGWTKESRARSHRTFDIWPLPPGPPSQLWRLLLGRT